MVTITEKEFLLLASFIEEHYGIHLKKEKQTLVTVRLQQVLQQGGFNSFTEYYDHLIADKSGSAIVTLVDKITTNHTYFMREADYFHYFKDYVLPFLRETVTDKDLRIWCAGCSSGEESYTLAMMIDEFFGKEKIWWNTKILATDISEEVLSIAKQGIYSNQSLASLPLHWKINYFQRKDLSHSIVIDYIKEEVIYRRFNLMEPVFPFKRKFHAIFCRNVMIYFDQPTKSELINKFYDHLEYGGYLFIGHSESLNRGMTNFRYIMPAVYRKG
jgi:chemotaxis protein methyltransferase CheR